LQLGAALVWARGRPEGHGFFTFDERLADAARQEGFHLVAPRGRQSKAIASPTRRGTSPKKERAD